MQPSQKFHEKKILKINSSNFALKNSYEKGPQKTLNFSGSRSYTTDGEKIDWSKPEPESYKPNPKTDLEPEPCKPPSLPTKPPSISRSNLKPILINKKLKPQIPPKPKNPNLDFPKSTKSPRSPGAGSMEKSKPAVPPKLVKPAVHFKPKQTEEGTEV